MSGSMPQCPRRTLLGGIGTTITVALAGNTVTATDADSTAEGGSAPRELGALQEYLPASAASDEDSIVLSASDFDRRRKADEPYEPRPTTGRFEIEPESVSKQVSVTTYGDEYTRPITVLAGDIQFVDEGDGETREAAGVEYEYYEADDGDGVAAVGDGVVVFATDSGTVEDAFAADAGETDRLLDAEPLLEEATGLYDDIDGYSVQLNDEYRVPGSDDDVEVDYVVRAMTVLGPDTIEMKYGIAFGDESDVTDELVESIESELAYQATKGDPTTEVDGDLVTVTAERDLAAERRVREHDSPGFLRADRDVDPDDDSLEIEIGRGDPTPVEDLTLEVGDEEYDREIWADGHGTLEEGDTIAIDMDDVEPNLSISLTHDHELGSSSSGTTILSRLRFEYDYDPDAETLTVEYADEFPLDGDSVTLAAYDERPAYRPDPDEGSEPHATAQPWTDETVSKGDQATVDGVRAGDTVLVGWDGTSQQDSIGTFRARPPGRVRFEYGYESETLSATIEFEDDGETRPADEYELLVDDEPTDTQWADEYETVTSGTTLEVDDVPVGTDVTVVWGDDARVGSTQTHPSIDLAFDEDEAAIEHAGGDAVPASKLTARVWSEDGTSEIDLADEIDGDFEDGDAVDIDADEVHHVTLRYGERRIVGFARP